MKTSTPTIKLVLRTSKKLSDGTSPIMFRAFWKGTKEKSSGFSALQRDWDFKRECLKKSAQNSAAINLELLKLKNKYIENAASLEALGEPFSVSDIFSYAKSKISDSRRYITLMERYMEARQLRYVTRLSHISTANALKKFFGRDVVLSDLTEENMRRFAASLKTSDGSKRQRLGAVGAVCSYAVELGLMNASSHPFRNWKWSRTLAKAHSTLYIHSRSMEFVKDYLLEKISVQTSERRWRYTNGATDVFTKIYSRDFAILLYYTMYLLQGLAPKDMALLKKRDVKTIIVRGDEYFSIDTRRSKTNVGVKIRKRKNGTALQILGGFLLFNASEYFLPILNKIEIEVDERIRNVGKYVNHYLKEHWRIINERIVKHNVENDDTVPLIDENCTLYSARHSFAMAYIKNPNATPIALATLMGRSVNTLGTYLQELSEEDDLIDAVSVM